MRSLFFLIIFNILSGVLNAQGGYFNNRYNLSNSFDAASSIIETDSSYVAVGFAKYDIGVLGINKEGTALWQKSYGRAGFDHFAGQSAALTLSHDKGYLLSASFFDTTGDSQIYLVKFTADFDTLWTRVYGDTGNYEAAYQCKQTPDSGFIIVCQVQKSPTQADISLIKTDSLGNIQWQKFYGGGWNETAYTVDIADDSGFIIGGGTESFGASENGYVVKTDKNGNQQWQKTFGGPFYDCAARVITAKDSGYIVCGCENMGNGLFQANITRLDSAGNTKWRKSYGPKRQTNDLWNVKELNDGSIVAVGVTDDPYVDGMMIKITADGDSLWYRTYKGSTGQDYMRDLILSSDGGFILAGFVAPSPGIDTGNQDMWIVKTDSLGYSCPAPTFYYEYDARQFIFSYPTPYIDSVLWSFGDGTTSTELNPFHSFTANGDYEVTLIIYHECGIDTFIQRINIDDVSVKEVKVESLKLKVVVYPNPFSESATIEVISPSGGGKGEVFKLYDILGREIASLPLELTTEGTAKATLNRGNLSSGIYYYKVANHKGIAGSGKLIIE